MRKTKQERELEEIARLADTYKKWTTEKLLAVRNGSPFSHTPKKYRIAINNELRARGVEI
jgi:hypothetical protein